MALTDEELQVIITATTTQFSKAMEDAKAEMVAFGKAGTKTFNSVNDAEKGFASSLTKGPIKGELKMISRELGTLAGASGLAGNQMGAFLGALAHLTSPLGLAVAGAAALASGIAFLSEKHKKAEEEAKKQAEADLKLADAFDKAAEAGAKLTATQVAMLNVLKEGQVAQTAALSIELEKQNKVVADLRGEYQDLVVQQRESGARNVNLKDQMDDLGKKYQTAVDAQTRLKFAVEGGTKALEAETEAGKFNEEQLKKEDDYWKVALKDREARNAAFDKSVDQHNKVTEAGLKRMEKEVKDFRTASAPFQRDFVTMIEAAGDGTQRLADVWGNFAKSFVKDAERMILNKAVMKLFDLLGGSLFGAGTEASTTSKGQGLLGGLLKHIPIFGGLFAEGGSFTTKGPTMFMAGEGGDPVEHVTVSKNGQSAGGGISIGQLVISGSGASTRSEAYALGQSQAAGLASGLSRMNLRLGVR